MKLLTRYILAEFLKPFLLSLASFSVLILIVQVFNDIKFILEHKPGILLTLKYFSLQVPELMILIVPLSVLFAVLFALSGLAKSNELIAMRAGGVNIFMVAIPLFFAGLIISFLSLGFNEIVVPKSNQMRHHTKVVEIEKQSESGINLVRQNISIRGANNGIYHIGTYDGNTNTMTDVLILQFDNGVHLKARIDAARAKFENGQWVFYNGFYRVFDVNDVEQSAQAFDHMPYSLPEKPYDFIKEQKEPGELNLPELVDYIRQLERNGSDCHKELVEFHKKLAFPFGCVILALLGVPWGWGMGRFSGVVMSFGICIMMAFFYLGGMQIGQNLGYEGVLSPFLSMWSMNILFAIGGPILIIRKNR